MPDRNYNFYQTIPAEVPRTPVWFMTGFFRWTLNKMGWQFMGDMPALERAVVIFVPHTSNWDFFIGICAKFSLRLRASYIMKKEAFFWPFKQWLINIGGIPIDRSQPALIAEQVSMALNQSGGNWLAITPEGTRKKVARYKTGFLRIAHTAKVPVVIAGLDYNKKHIIFAKVIEATEEFEKDADSVHQYCRETFVGKRPENQ